MYLSIVDVVIVVVSESVAVAWVSNVRAIGRRTKYREGWVGLAWASIGFNLLA